jgi:putative tricarboxylic transport membrane protein
MRARAWSLGFLGASVAYLAGALTFPLGSIDRPGPGFFPVGVGAFLCLSALATAVFGLAGPTAAGLHTATVARVAVTVAALVGFCLLLPWLGYPICAFVFVTLLMRRLAGVGWPGAVVTAVLSSLATFYLFGVVLGVPLPRGPF